MIQKIIKVKGMHCQSCVKSIETKLNLISGIKEVKVNLVKEIAKIKFDSNKINLSQIKSEINKIGFSTDNKKTKKKQNKKNKGGFLQGLIYGIIPHIGCIAFIIGSILGVTVLMNFFKPILMNKYFFHALIGIALGFATLSSGIYLKKNELLSWEGIKKKWKYISIMYGSTIGINLVLFMLIFPLLANVSIDSPSITGAVAGIENDEGINSILKIKVDIPCPGHAPLISGELKTIEGVKDIKFSFPNNFEISYDSAKTSKQEMLKLSIFETYAATVIGEEVLNKVIKQNNQLSPESCCGGTGSCGNSNSCGCGNY